MKKFVLVILGFSSIAFGMENDKFIISVQNTVVFPQYEEITMWPTVKDWLFYEYAKAEDIELLDAKMKKMKSVIKMAKLIDQSKKQFPGDYTRACKTRDGGFMIKACTTKKVNKDELKEFFSESPFIGIISDPGNQFDY